MTTPVPSRKFASARLPEPNGAARPTLVSAVVPQAPLPAPVVSVDGQALAGNKQSTTVTMPGWTVAVNLGSTMRDKKTGEAIGGSALKSEELKALAARTAGSPVMIVAQEVIKSSTEPDAPDAPAMLQSYTIRNGQIVTDPKQVPSRGYASDVERLVAKAGQEPGRLAVILDSHGNGYQGMSGDSGRASTQDIANALKSGLAQTGRSKADLLDLDACLMGQVEALAPFQGLADRVVASSENGANLVHAMGAFKPQGQSLGRSLGALIDNPGMDAKQLGDTMVELARTNQRTIDWDADGQPDRVKLFDPTSPIQRENSTPTLSSLDMADMPALRQAVDGLGDQLFKAMEPRVSPRNAAAIQAAIFSIPTFGSNHAEGDTPTDACRDLKAFTDALDDGLRTQRIKDSGGLKAAIDTLRTTQSKVVEAYHGEGPELSTSTTRGYDKMGGLSVFLPSKAFFDPTPRRLPPEVDPDKEAILAGINKNLDTLDSLVGRETSENFDQRFDARWAIEQNLGALKQRLSDLPPSSAATHGRAIDRLEQIMGEFKAAESPEASSEKLGDFRYILATGTLKMKEFRGADELAQQEIDKEFAAGRIGAPNSGWNRFLSSLQRDARR